MIGNLADAVRVTNRRATELLHDQGHGQTRYRSNPQVAFRPRGYRQT
jgi:hypothetical protein